MASKPPIKRRDPLASGGVEEVSTELQAQIEARERRKARARKAARPKATYDLSTKVIDQVKRVAAEEDVSQSDIVAWALTEFLDRYREGGVELAPHKKPTRSLRVLFKLELPPNWE